MDPRLKESRGAEPSALVVLAPFGLVEVPFVAAELARPMRSLQLTADSTQSQFGLALARDDDCLAVSSARRVEVFRHRHADYVQVGSVDTQDEPRVALADGRLYVGTTAGVSTYDVTDAALVWRGQLDLDGEPVLALACDAERLFVGTARAVHVYALPSFERLQSLDSVGEVLAYQQGTLLAGDPRRGGPRDESGAVDVFLRTPEGYARSAVLTASDAQPDGPNSPRVCVGHACTGGGPPRGERFGSRIAFDHDVVAISNAEGSTYLYRREGDRFVEQLELHDAQAPASLQAESVLTPRPFHVALDRGRVALGEPCAQAGPLPCAGAVHLLHWEGMTLVHDATFAAERPAIGGRFGTELLFDDDALLVAAPGDNLGTVTRLDLCASTDAGLGP